MKKGGGTYPTPPETYPPTQPEPEKYPEPAPAPPEPDTDSPARPPGAPPAPPTFATDPDPSKSVHCTAPYAPSSPLVQWALMLDAGSTGSRIHVYKFNNCGAAPQYEYEVFRKVTPGLSAFEGDAEGAARSLDELMEEAVGAVPEGARGCAPVAVRATAGLRVLGAEKSSEILRAVRARLETRYPFPVAKEDGVTIMDGKDEGVYAWITANYLLDTLRATTPGPGPSYAVLDLGGASTQIAFEPAGAATDAGAHAHRVVFGGRTHVLYQHSYLGYGLMHARKRVHRLVEFMYEARGGEGGGEEEGEVANPCLARDTARTVELEDPLRTVRMVGADVGGLAACRRVVELVLAKDASCPVAPCSFAGVYQPAMHDAFPASAGHVLLLSYFYDRLAPLLPAGTTTLPLATIATLAERVCAGAEAWAEHWGPGAPADDGGNAAEDAEHAAAAMEELRGRPEYCLDLTFMHALLGVGYGLAPEREVRIAKQVAGTEMGWCLGAAIAMVEGAGEGLAGCAA
ncbi:nucleoside phosphatase GDA1/CD39 [Gautieria morchelliformis]|nr:nucleoside phosphatase GDA1/CD39 [Gautieria morchelliformis]